MPTAATLRKHIEQILQDRIPAALTPRPVGARECIPSGIAELDRLMHGGFPVGALAELVGPACSGRTTAALALLANVTSRGSVCAWIDASNTLDPESAAANGVRLDRLLWIRCSSNTPPVTDKQASAAQSAALPERSKVPVSATGGGSPHPRSEGNGMSDAIGNLLATQPGSAAIQPKRRDRSIGTPGAPNRPLTSRSQHLQQREEQVPTDRLPARRGSNLPLLAEGYKPLHMEQHAATASSTAAKPKNETNHWSALDSALRSADLLLQAGGFQAIVLDLGSTPADQAWRIPMATWFRFRTECERSRVSFLILTQHPCARSSAELVLRMHPDLPVHSQTVLAGLKFYSEAERQRQHRSADCGQAKSNIVAMRRPVQPDRGKAGYWQAAAPWTRAQ